MDKVNDDAEVVIVSRSKGKNVVVMDLDRYNAITETQHLVKSEANRKRLKNAIYEMDTGIHQSRRFIEE